MKLLNLIRESLKISKDDIIHELKYFRSWKYKEDLPEQEVNFNIKRITMMLMYRLKITDEKENYKNVLSIVKQYYGIK